MVHSCSALILCILLLSQISWSPLVFPLPHQWQYHYGKLVSIAKTPYSASLLWCLGHVHVFLHNSSFFTFSVMPFEKGEKGRLQVTSSQQGGWEDVVCLSDWRCWRHLDVPLCNMAVKMTWPALNRQQFVPAVQFCSCICSCSKEKSYKNKCWTRWGRDDWSFGWYKCYGLQGKWWGWKLNETER